MIYLSVSFFSTGQSRCVETDCDNTLWDRPQLPTWLLSQGERAAALFQTDWRSSWAIKEGEKQSFLAEQSDAVQTCLGFWCWQVSQPWVRKWQHTLRRIAIHYWSLSVSFTLSVSESLSVSSSHSLIFSLGNTLELHIFLSTSKLSLPSKANCIMRLLGNNVYIVLSVFMTLTSAGWAGAPAQVPGGQLWKGRWRWGGQTQLLALAGNLL